MSAFAARKRRKLDNASEPRASTEPDLPHSSTETQSFPRGASEGVDAIAFEGPEVRNGESLVHLRRMVLGEAEHTAPHKQYVPILLHIPTPSLKITSNALYLFSDLSARPRVLLGLANIWLSTARW